jgi:threonine dehydratase
VQCFFKCENFQRGGAFKIRGAANFLLSLPESDRTRGVVAFSSGNHAQAVAIAARELGMKATIAMPTDAPSAKLEATRAYGAEIVLYDRMKDDREAVARKLAEETGAVVAPPFDHEWIIAGREPLLWNCSKKVPDFDALVVCVGGGGLLSGSCLAAKGTRADIRVFAAEPEQGERHLLVIPSGHRVEIPPPDTIADGLRPNKPGAITFPIVQRHVEEVLLATEDEIRQAVSFVQSRMKMVIEPSGAVPAAVVMAHKLPPGIRRAGLIVSGGNV